MGAGTMAVGVTGGDRQTGWVVAAVVQAVLIAWLAWGLSDAGNSTEAAAGEDAVPQLEEGPTESSGEESGDVQDAREAPASAAAEAPSRVEVDGVPQAASPADSAVLFGRVCDPEGEGLAAGLAIYSAGERVATTSPDRGADGRFAIPDLAPGPYELVASLAEYRDAKIAFEIPDGVDRKRLDVTLESSWRLMVRFVTPEGRPLAEAQKELVEQKVLSRGVSLAVIATAEPPPEEFPETGRSTSPFGLGTWRSVRNSFGRIALPTGVAGMLELDERRPLFVSAMLSNYVLATKPVEAGQEEVRIELMPEDLLGQLCTVRLRVVDAETGEPIPGAKVGLNERGSWSPGVEVDAEGRVELTGRRPGVVGLSVRAGVRAPLGWEVRLEPGATVDLGDIALADQVPLSVLFEGPGPDVDVSVYLKPLDATTHPSLQPKVTRVWNGKERMERAIPPGRWRVDATASGWSGRAEIDTARMGGEPLVLRLEPTVMLRVLPPESGPALEIEVLDAAGRAWMRSWLTGSRPVVRQIPAGSYTAVLKGLDGSEVRRMPVEVSADGGLLDLR